MNFHEITIPEHTVDKHVATGSFVGTCFDNCDLLCDDNNPCTIDVDPINTAIDTCTCLDAGKCPPVECGDDDPLTIDTCDPTPGSGCVYTCISGYEMGADGSCVDIDECSQGTDHCSALPETPICENTIGGYNCVAPPPPEVQKCVYDSGWIDIVKHCCVNQWGMVKRFDLVTADDTDATKEAEAKVTFYIDGGNRYNIFRWQCIQDYTPETSTSSCGTPVRQYEYPITASQVNTAKATSERLSYWLSIEDKNQNYGRSTCSGIADKGRIVFEYWPVVGEVCPTAP